MGLLQTLACKTGWHATGTLCLLESVELLSVVLLNSACWKTIQLYISLCHFVFVTCMIMNWNRPTVFSNNPQCHRSNLTNHKPSKYKTHFCETLPLLRAIYPHASVDKVSQTRSILIVDSSWTLAQIWLHKPVSLGFFLFNQHNLKRNPA